MTPLNARPDQFGRTSVVTATRAIVVTPAAPITGSLWPNQAGSDQANLDTAAFKWGEK